MRLALYDLSHMCYRNLISSPVEDESIVVDVLNFVAKKSYEANPL